MKQYRIAYTNIIRLLCLAWWQGGYASIQCNMVVVSLLWFAVVSSSGLMYAQGSVIPTSLEERVTHAETIIEGTIVEQFTMRPSPQGLIFTAHVIAPSKLLKGTLTAGDTRWASNFSSLDSSIRIVMITSGGRYRSDYLVVTPSLSLSVGDQGIFLLKTADRLLNAGVRQELSHNTESPIAPSTLSAVPLSAAYLPSGGMQAVLKYTVSSGLIAADMIETYPDIDDLQHRISTITHTPIRILTGVSLPDMTPKISSDGIAQIATIASISPLTISGGAGVAESVITITGNGFGTRTGQANVLFRDANSSAPVFFPAPSSAIISWSPTQIVVQVPSGTATGAVRVQVSGGSSATSGQQISIPFNIINISAPDGIPYRAALVNRNGRGGSTITPNADFQQNTLAYRAFIRALSAWRCASGVNFRPSSTTATATNTNNTDGLNVISFVNAYTQPDADASILGVTYNYYASCPVGTRHSIYQTEFDMEFISTPRSSAWDFGTTAIPNQFNFFTFVLHELGHAHQLGHVQSQTSLMFPAIPAGTVRSIDANTLRGAQDVMSIANFYTQCQQISMPTIPVIECDLSAFQAPPAVPVLVSPADSAVNQPINTLLQWNPANGALSYDVELDTTSSFSAPIVSQIGITATSAQLTRLIPQRRYFWRVRSVNSFGRSAYAVRSFNTQMPTRPTTPFLITPLDGASGLPLSVNLTWEVVPSAETYEVQVSANSSFSPLFAVQIVTTTNFSLSGLQILSQYYWRVRARNSADVSDWSLQRIFTTQGPPSPDPPLLLSPADNASNTELSVVATWTAVQGATGYDIQVSQRSDYSTLLYDQPGINTTRFVIPNLLSGTTFFWRVRSRNDIGVSQWVERRFTTQAPQPPEPPILSFPDDGSPRENINVTLSWVTPLVRVSYNVQVATNASFTGSLVRNVIRFDPSPGNINGSETFSYPVTGLQYSTQYFWRIQAENSAGASIWVQRSFTTQPPPPPDSPRLSLPEDGAIGQPTNLTLLWLAANNATGYDVEVSPSSGFIPLIASRYNNPATNFRLSNTQPGATYFWRVRSRNAIGDVSPWIQASFTTIGLPQSPEIITPLEGSVNPTSTIGSWLPASGATTYNLQVSLSPSFNEPLAFGNIGVIEPFAWMSGLAENRTYYMRVQPASPTGGVGEWSRTRTFSTFLLPPQVPFNLVPKHEAENQARNTELRWTTATNANLIHIQMTTNRNAIFTLESGQSTDIRPLLINDSTIRVTPPYITSRSLPPLTLPPLTEIFWRIRAKRGPHWSGWSMIHSYTTGQFVNATGSSITTPSNEFIRTATVLPNPASDMVIVQWVQEKFAATRIELINITGQSLYSSPLLPRSIGTHEHSVNVQQLSSGTYFMRLHCGTITVTIPLVILR